MSVNRIPSTVLGLLAAGCLAMAQAATAAGLDDKVPYPKPESGMERLVIHLPETANEADMKVELLVGKTMSVDCNRHWFGGDMVEHNVQGWGYPYYRVDKISGPASTLMACPGGSRHEAFVRATGTGYLIAYNSKLPIVAYVPAGFEMRYRTWTASGIVGTATRQ